MTPPATIADFQAQFNREFDYGVRKDQVMDSDITRSLNEAAVIFNCSLWVDTTEEIIAFLYASAHFLVLNLRAAGGLSLDGFTTSPGINAIWGGTVVGKTAGGVSLTMQFPEWIMNSPILSGFLTTAFGQKYLQLLTPRLVGAGFVVAGFNENAGLEENKLPDQSPLPTSNFDVDPTIAPVVYMFYTMGTVETSARIILPRSGTIKALIIKAAANTLNGQAIVTLLKNGTAQTLATSLAVGETFNQDAFHSVPISGNDEISIKVDVSAATSGLLSSLRATVIFQP